MVFDRFNRYEFFFLIKACKYNQVCIKCRLGTSENTLMGKCIIFCLCLSWGYSVLFVLAQKNEEELSFTPQKHKGQQCGALETPTSATKAHHLKMSHLSRIKKSSTTTLKLHFSQITTSLPGLFNLKKKNRQVFMKFVKAIYFFNHCFSNLLLYNYIFLLKKL